MTHDGCAVACTYFDESVGAGNVAPAQFGRALDSDEVEAVRRYLRLGGIVLALDKDASWTRVNTLAAEVGAESRYTSVTASTSVNWTRRIEATPWTERTTEYRHGSTSKRTIQPGPDAKVLFRNEPFYGSAMAPLAVMEPVEAGWIYFGRYAMWADASGDDATSYSADNGMLAASICR